MTTFPLMINTITLARPSCPDRLSVAADSVIDMEMGAAVIDGDGVAVDVADFGVIPSLEFLTDSFTQERRVEAVRLWITARWTDSRSDGMDDYTSLRPGLSDRSVEDRPLSQSKGGRDHGTPHHDQHDDPRPAELSGQSVSGGR